jgi:hypothetical protein
MCIINVRSAARLGFDDVALRTFDEADDGFPVLAGETAPASEKWRKDRFAAQPPTGGGIALPM